MITKTYDDIHPIIVYRVDSPLRHEFEEYVRSEYPPSCAEFNLKKDSKGNYIETNIYYSWVGYHDRALQENLKLRDAPVLRELSDEAIDVQASILAEYFFDHPQIGYPYNLLDKSSRNILRNAVKGILYAAKRKP